MKVGSIFSEDEYGIGFNYAVNNNLTIKEIDSKKEEREIEEEIINEKGEKEIKKEKKIVDIRYFQIVEKRKTTNEEISRQRQNAYIERTDPLTLRKLRKQALNDWTSEDEKEYILQIQNISEQIEKEFPYNSDEPIL